VLKGWKQTIIKGIDLLTPPKKPNLLGDRDIEWSWIAANIPNSGGIALDFGTGGGPLALLAAMKGYRVTGLDINEISWPYCHPSLTFTKGDILKIALPKNNFDLIINCSTVEHVGISGRYDVIDEIEDGDLKAMDRLKTFMKPNGIMLLTIPVGLDAIFRPMHRVYGTERLPKLLKGYKIIKEDFWVKNEKNNWILSEKGEALKYPPRAGSTSLRSVYAIGCFCLHA